MYRGEVLHVHLNKPTQSVWIRGTVAWCRRHDAGGYRVGMRFVHRITEHEARLAVDVESMTVTAAEPERSKLPVWRRKQRHPGNAVSDGSALSRQAAFGVLHRVQSTRRPTVEDERTVVSLARHADVEVRRKCVAALSKLGTRPARAALLTMLKDADDKVREQTVVAAGILGMHEAIRALRQLLLDADQSIALRAAGALGRLGDRTGLPLAVQMLEHDTTHARLAAQAFGDIIGKKFSSNTAGVNAARRTLQAERNTLLTVA
jgi:HEAT repeat protein